MQLGVAGDEILQYRRQSRWRGRRALGHLAEHGDDPRGRPPGQPQPVRRQLPAHHAVRWKGPGGASAHDTALGIHERLVERRG